MLNGFRTDEKGVGAVRKNKRRILAGVLALVLTMLPYFSALAAETQEMKVSVSIPGVTVTCPDHGKIQVDINGKVETKGPGTYDFPVTQQPNSVSVTAVPNADYKAEISCTYAGEHSISTDKKKIMFNDLNGVASVKIAFKYSPSPSPDPTPTPSGGSSGSGPSVKAYTKPTVGAKAVSGSWTKVNGIWNFTSGGSLAKGGWYYLGNPYSLTANTGWFCFDENGTMKTGWVLSADGSWYFCHDREDGDLGKMQTGWHYDAQDGHTYYLDPVTGAMATGWKQIDGNWYYFYESSEGSVWHLENGKWVATTAAVQPYGSLVVNATTPDGKRVDVNGIRVN